MESLYPLNHWRKMSNDSVFHRRNKQIQDAIDSQNLKQALQLCEKRIKKGEDSRFLRVGFSAAANNFRPRSISSVILAVRWLTSFVLHRHGKLTFYSLTRMKLITNEVSRKLSRYVDSTLPLPISTRSTCFSRHSKG